MRKETLHPHPLYLAGDVSLRAEGMPIPLHVLGETAELLPSRSPEPFAPLVILPLNEVKGKNFTAQDRLREEASKESLPGLLGYASQPLTHLAIASNGTMHYQSPERVHRLPFEVTRRYNQVRSNLQLGWVEAMKS